MFTRFLRPTLRSMCMNFLHECVDVPKNLASENISEQQNKINVYIDQVIPSKLSNVLSKINFY